MQYFVSFYNFLTVCINLRGCTELLSIIGKTFPQSPQQTPIAMSSCKRCSTAHNLFCSIPPSLLKQYLQEKLKRDLGPGNDSYKTERLDKMISCIVDTACPDNTIYKEDFTRREIRRLWDNDETRPRVRRENING